MKGFRFFPSLLVAFVLAVQTLGQAQAQDTYYINDHLGSPIAAEDENGNLLWRESYSAYGERQLRENSQESSPGFTGKRHYSELGLSYFGARWYDSTTGRFITPDPAGWQESSPYFSFNQYAYANNNPYVYTDPDGELPFLVPVAIFLAKEAAGYLFEEATGLPAIFSVKGAGKAIFKQGKKLIKQSPPKTRVFWSGRGTREAAEKFAKANNGTTLNMTITGKLLDKLTNDRTWKATKPLWRISSQRFAKNAKNDVHFFQSKHGYHKKGIWETKELPILTRQGNKIHRHIVD